MIGTAIVFAIAGALWLAGLYAAIGFALTAEPPRTSAKSYERKGRNAQ